MVGALFSEFSSRPLSAFGSHWEACFTTETCRRRRFSLRCRVGVNTATTIWRPTTSAEKEPELRGKGEHFFSTYRS